MEKEKAIIEEGQRMRRLRFLVDLTTSILRQERMNLNEAYQLVEALKRQILLLFPDKLETYNLILKPRFDRIIRERFRIS